METEKEGDGGPCCGSNSPNDIVPIEDKILSHPELCQRCDGEYYIQPDGPDAGKLFACGIMVENIEAGCMSFACPYSKSAPNTMTVVGDKLRCDTSDKTCFCQPDEGKGTCGKIIDAEVANAALRLCNDLKARRVWKITEVSL